MRFQMLIGFVGLLCTIYFGKEHLINQYIKPELSYKIAEPHLTEKKLLKSDGEAIVAINGIDPYYQLIGESNLLYNSVFWNPTQIKTSSKWKPPTHSEKIADAYLARSIKGGVVSKERVALMKWLGRKTELPVVSLVVDNESFFSEENGIYVQGNAWNNNLGSPLNETWFDKKGNYSNRGQNWEVPAYAQFFSSKQDVLWQGEVGVRINGNATRSFQQKSLRLVSKLKLIPGVSLGNAESLILRNGGNSSNSTFINDLVLQSMLDSTNLLYQKGQPCVVLLNGFYWGIHNIRDRWKSEDIARYNNCLPSEVGVWEKGKIVSGNKKFKKKLKKLFKKLGDNEATYEEIKKRIKLKNFADFVLFQAWVANEDWPTNNYAMYKISGEKWRFMVQDLDLAMGVKKNDNSNMNVFHRLYNSNGELGLLYKGLITNDKFQKLLISRYLILKKKGVFSSDRLNEKIKILVEKLNNEIKFHKKRWGNNPSEEVWKQKLNEIIIIAIIRERVIDKQINNFEFIPTDI